MEPETNNDEDFEKIESEIEDETEDSSTYDIISYGADFTLSVLYDKMKKGEIIVPEFQRRFVWNIKQASKLVESFLLGLPVPGIFLAKDKKTGNLLVIDGQQRLKTCRAFRDEKYPLTDESFTLKKVHEKWEGKLYSDLIPADRKRFDVFVLRATIIQQINPKDNTSTYHIFQRLNTGGTILQNQEIRNCLFHGKFNDLLFELNKDKTWRSLYRSGEHKRMKDIELILRFFALYYKYESYTKPMNEFLSNYMADNRDMVDADIEKSKKLFLDTISLIFDRVGPEAFRPKGNINGSAFDSIMYTVSKYKTKLKDNLDKCILELFKDQAYLKAIREGTTDPDTIRTRFSIAKRYLVKE